MIATTSETTPAPVGIVETALYAFALTLAAGPLDRAILLDMVSSSVRAALWAVVYAGFLWILASRRGLSRRILTGIWPLLTLPLLALLSVLWSIRPPETIVGTLEMTAAILFGAVIGCRLDDRRFIPMVIIVLSGLALVDFAVVLTNPIGLDINGDAVGIFSHKNANGEIMALLTLASLSVLVWGGPRLVALGGLLLGVPMLALSGSRTAWLVAAAGAAGIVLVGLRRMAPAARLVTLFIGLAVGTAAVAVWLDVETNVVDTMLDLLGKDSTLTGRTVLWDLASGYIGESPLIGHGFNSFWSLDPTTDAAYVDRVLKEDLQSFHNGYLELAVELGWLGTALEIAIMAAFLRPLGRLIGQAAPSMAAFALALLLLVAISNLSEVALFVRHGFNLLLLSALWSRAYAEGNTVPAIGRIRPSPQWSAEGAPR